MAIGERLLHGSKLRRKGSIGSGSEDPDGVGSADSIGRMILRNATVFGCFIDGAEMLLALGHAGRLLWLGLDILLDGGSMLQRL